MGEQEGGAMRQGTEPAAARGGRDATEAEGQPSSPHDIDAAERRLLASMPLHAITALHGEAGLRERFAIETASFPGPERDRIEQAQTQATEHHVGDRRQLEPYSNHLLRVATRIISHYGVRDPDVICAALLHDAVEDHSDSLVPGGGRQRALATLATRFGNRVAELVAAVTNPEHEPGRDRNEQYREHVAASLETSPQARVIKASDFTDNGVGLIHTTGPKLKNLASKYAPLVPVLAGLIARPDTPLTDPAKRRVLDQLNTAQQRFAAIRPAPATADTPG
jgi:hypothetical protein